MFLSGLRDPYCDIYRLTFRSDNHGPEEVDAVCRTLHEEAFAVWLNYNLEQQKTDLDLFLSTLNIDRRTVIDTWLNLESYRLFVPASAEFVARQLFFCEIRVLLSVVGNASLLLGSADPDPEASGSIGTAPVRTPLSACAVRCRDSISPLSAREQEVFTLLACGKTTKEIAATLFISAATVNQHRKHISKKLGIHSTCELVACAVARRSGVCRLLLRGSPFRLAAD